MGKATHYQPDHDNVDHRFAGGCLAFVVLAQPAMMIEPGEGALHDPASGQNGKALLLLRTEHDSQTKPAVLCDPVE